MQEKPAFLVKPTASPLAGLAARVGDHAVLDFLNTVARVDGELVDALQSDADVRGWLAGAGYAAPASASLPAHSLLETARALRDKVRRAIEQRKDGRTVQFHALNMFLAETNSHLVLRADKRGVLELERRWEPASAEQVLAPLAEAAADLLVHGDFEMIRPCEDNQCVLWFYDRTRSHRRRWCSMAACGNRNKVAAFRERQQLEQ